VTDKSTTIIKPALLLVLLVAMDTPVRASAVACSISAVPTNDEGSTVSVNVKDNIWP